MPETCRDIEHQESGSESEVCIKLVVLLCNYARIACCTWEPTKEAISTSTLPHITPTNVTSIQ
jgi:hypothetical protein